MTIRCPQNTATNSRIVALGQKYAAVGEPVTWPRTPSLRAVIAARNAWKLLVTTTQT